MRVILPGSYDPVTLGHLEIIRRASEIYEEVFVVVFVNPEKEYTFSLSDRVSMLMLATEELDNVLVSYSLGRVVDYMREHNIKKIIKGIRNDEDLAYERPQAEYNFKHGGYETEYLTSSPEFAHISSTLARKKQKAGERLEGILPKKVIEFIENH